MNTNHRPSLVSLENIPHNAEPSDSFVYPDEDLPPDMKLLAQEYVEKLYQQKIQEFVKRLLMELITKSNPKTWLASFCYASGIDLRYMLKNDKDSYTSIALELGCSRQNFHKSVKRIRKQYNLRAVILKKKI